MFRVFEKGAGIKIEYLSFENSQFKPLAKDNDLACISKAMYTHQS